MRAAKRLIKVRVPSWRQAKPSWSGTPPSFSFTPSSTSSTSASLRSRSWSAKPSTATIPLQQTDATVTPAANGAGKKYPDEETELFFDPRLRGHTFPHTSDRAAYIATRRNWIKSLSHVPKLTAATNADFNRFVLRTSHKGGASYRINEIIKTAGTASAATISSASTTASTASGPSASVTKESESESMKVRAVVGDLAGTIVNLFSTDPAEAFQNSLKEAGYFITLAEARGPTGIDKGSHQKALFQLLVTRKFMTEEKRDDPKFHEQMMKLYQEHQLKVSKFTKIIPGADRVIKDFQRDDILFGATTGYYSPVTSVVLKKIWKDCGVSLDACVSADELPQGRSRPFGDGIVRCLARMGLILSRSLKSEPDAQKRFNVSNLSILSADELNSFNKFASEKLKPEQLYQFYQNELLYHISGPAGFESVNSTICPKIIIPRQVIKADDTVVGVKEGQDAGVWTVAIFGTSVLMEVDSVAHFKSLTDKQVIHRLYNSCIELEKSRPDYLILDISDLPLAKAAINKRLKADDNTSLPSSLPPIRLFDFVDAKFNIVEDVVSL